MLKQRKKQKRYSIMHAAMELEKEMPELPDKEVYKFISDGHFSSISFVKYLSKRTVINELYASSFRIGRKELQLLDGLHKSGQIKKCHFAVGTLMANDSLSVKRYRYYDNFKDVCDKNDWEYITTNNHSKIILFDTDIGKFVLETSSNLNENPKIEQFSFEKDSELFEFYKAAFHHWSDADG